MTVDLAQWTPLMGFELPAALAPCRAAGCRTLIVHPMSADSLQVVHNNVSLTIDETCYPWRRAIRGSLFYEDLITDLIISWFQRTHIEEFPDTWVPEDPLSLGE